MLNKALENVILNLQIEVIDDCESIIETSTIGQLVVSGFWAGKYVRVKKESILSAYPENLII